MRNDTSTSREENTIMTIISLNHNYRYSIDAAVAVGNYV
jgi:hypothetical protein